MPAEVVTGHFCADYFSTFKVPGSAGRSWYVDMRGTDVRCDCPAFRFSRDRSCKHVTYVWEHACLWNEQWCSGQADDLEPEPDSLCYPIIPGESCPRCGGPVCPVKIAV